MCEVKSASKEMKKRSSFKMSSSRPVFAGRKVGINALLYQHFTLNITFCTDDEFKIFHRFSVICFVLFVAFRYGQKNLYFHRIQNWIIW